MSLYDFFFPEQAQATHLRKLAEKQNARSNLAAKRADYASREVGDLQIRLRDAEKDLASVSLLLAALLELMQGKGSITRDELKKKIAELDWLDGFQDGELDIDILRGRTTW